jgi:hypothetical protein
MRRLVRWTFNILAAASLLLCVATAALWVRSYSVYDGFVAQRAEASKYGREYSVAHYSFDAQSCRGQLAITVDWSDAPEYGPTPPWGFGHRQQPRPRGAWTPTPSCIPPIATSKTALLTTGGT